MKRKIKKAGNKKSPKVKSRLLGAALITTLLLGGTASQANAVDFLKTFNDLRKGADSLLNSIKNDPTISSILNGVNQITTVFLPQIQQFTGISNADINRVKGVLNILAPSETQKAIDSKKDTLGSESVIPSQNQAARGAATTTAETVLSQEGQKLDKKNLDDISKLVQETGEVAASSARQAESAQEASSSQDILKILASQSSNQAAINASHLRLLALQNNNLQAIKTQLAVTNQVNAGFESRLQGEAQQKILVNQEKILAIIKENGNKYRK